MRILVCGGRDFSDWPVRMVDIYKVKQAKKEYDYVHDTLDNLVEERDIDLDDIVLICGMARGVDSTAYAWANSMEPPLGIEKYPADWDKYGKSAGYIRNQQMLTEGRPDLVVAFPGGKGTKMMVDIATKGGVKVLEYSPLGT